MQEAVANFQPKGQDLDYPGKLQCLAEQPESIAASADTEQTPLVGTAVPNGDSSTLVSLSNTAGQCCLIYTQILAAFTASTEGAEMEDIWRVLEQTEHNSL